MRDILVIGDSCRDIFVYCDAERLAPDFPVPILNVIEQVENDGMARNVLNNVKTQVPNAGIIDNGNWFSITKTRYVHHKTNHMFFRVDSKEKSKQIATGKIELDAKLVIISDYDKGFLDVMDIADICHRHNRVFLDTKKKLGTWAEEAFIIKINDYEYQRSRPHLTPSLKEKIIHTMGGEGCEFNGNRYPVEQVEVKDSSGAGDSFMAALVIMYLTSSHIGKSIMFANQCASEVVKHRGVTTI